MALHRSVPITTVPVHSCPLGLRLQSGATAGNGGKLVKSNQPERRRPCAGDDAIDNETSADNDGEAAVEKLTQSGMYLNPNQALKYLSQQLGGVKDQLYGETKNDISNQVIDAKNDVVDHDSSTKDDVGQPHERSAPLTSLTSSTSSSREVFKRKADLR